MLKGWRFPTEDTNGEFDTLNTDMGDSYENWQPTGVFKGSFAGFVNGNTSTPLFYGQSSNADLWSSPAGDNTYASSTYFYDGFVRPSYYNARNHGFAVRCVVS